ncbi:MAG: hypothetical protein WCZ86_06060 [Desulfurivibrionaceae bacterium]
MSQAKTPATKRIVRETFDSAALSGTGLAKESALGRIIGTKRSVEPFQSYVSRVQSEMQAAGVNPVTLKWEATRAAFLNHGGGKEPTKRLSHVMGLIDRDLPGVTPELRSLIKSDLFSQASPVSSARPLGWNEGMKRGSKAADSLFAGDDPFVDPTELSKALKDSQTQQGVDAMAGRVVKAKTDRARASLAYRTESPQAIEKAKSAGEYQLIDEFDKMFDGALRPIFETLPTHSWVRGKAAEASKYVKDVFLPELGAIASMPQSVKDSFFDVADKVYSTYAPNAQAPRWLNRASQWITSSGVAPTIGGAVQMGAGAGESLTRPSQVIPGVGFVSGRLKHAVDLNTSPEYAKLREAAAAGDMEARAIVESSKADFLWAALDLVDFAELGSAAKLFRAPTDLLANALERDAQSAVWDRAADTFVAPEMKNAWGNFVDRLSNLRRDVSAAQAYIDLRESVGQGATKRAQSDPELWGGLVDEYNKWRAENDMRGMSPKDFADADFGPTYSKASEDVLGPEGAREVYDAEVKAWNEKATPIQKIHREWKLAQDEANVAASSPDPATAAASEPTVAPEAPQGDRLAPPSGSAADVPPQEPVAPTVPPAPSTPPPTPTEAGIPSPVSGRKADRAKFDAMPKRGEGGVSRVVKDLTEGPLSVPGEKAAKKAGAPAMGMSAESTAALVESFYDQIAKSLGDGVTADEVADRFWGGVGSFADADVPGSLASGDYSGAYLDGKSYAGKGANPSTAPHEAAYHHSMDVLKQIAPDWHQEIIDELNHTGYHPRFIEDMKKAKAAGRPIPPAAHAEESGARYFEDYGASGVAPTPKLQKYFDWLKGVISEWWEKIKTKKTPVPDNLRAMFDEMFGGDPQPKAEARKEPRVTVTERGKEATKVTLPGENEPVKLTKKEIEAYAAQHKAHREMVDKIMADPKLSKAEKGKAIAEANSQFSKWRDQYIGGTEAIQKEVDAMLPPEVMKYGGTGKFVDENGLPLFQPLGTKVDDEDFLWATHFGRSGITEFDPRMLGSGAFASPRDVARRQAGDAFTYFFADMAIDEPFVSGGTKYTVRIDPSKVWDATSDPDNLIGETAAKLGGRPNLDEQFAAAKAKGYDGAAVNRHGDAFPDVIVMWTTSGIEIVREEPSRNEDRLVYEGPTPRSKFIGGPNNEWTRPIEMGVSRVPAIRPKESQVIVSSNTGSGQTAAQAEAKIGDRNHAATRAHVERLLRSHGVSPKVIDAIGNWLDDSEENLVALLPRSVSLEVMRVIAAKSGIKAKQKAVIIWRDEPVAKATGSLTSFKVKGASKADVQAKVLSVKNPDGTPVAPGVTVTDDGDGYRVWVLDTSDTTGKTGKALYKGMAVQAGPIEVRVGTGEFVGDATDNPTKNRARINYEKIIKGERRQRLAEARGRAAGRSAVRARPSRPIVNRGRPASPLFQPIDDAIRAWEQGEVPEGFHLKSVRLLAQKLRGAQPPAQIRAMLKSNGVTEQEMKWTGLARFLDEVEAENQGKVELDDILHAITLGIRVPQRHFGSIGARDRSDIPWEYRDVEDFDRALEIYDRYRDEAESDYVSEMLNDYEDEYKSANNLTETVEDPFDAFRFDVFKSAAERDQIRVTVRPENESHGFRFVRDGGYTADQYEAALKLLRSHDFEVSGGEENDYPLSWVKEPEGSPVLMVEGAHWVSGQLGTPGRFETTKGIASTSIEKVFLSDDNVALLMRGTDEGRLVLHARKGDVAFKMLSVVQGPIRLYGSLDDVDPDVTEEAGVVMPLDFYALDSIDDAKEKYRDNLYENAYQNVEVDLAYPQEEWFESSYSEFDTEGDAGDPEYSVSTSSESKEYEGMPFEMPVTIRNLGYFSGHTPAGVDRALTWLRGRISEDADGLTHIGVEEIQSDHWKEARTKKKAITERRDAQNAIIEAFDIFAKENGYEDYKESMSSYQAAGNHFMAVQLLKGRHHDVMVGEAVSSLGKGYMALMKSLPDSVAMTPVSKIRTPFVGAGNMQATYGEWIERLNRDFDADEEAAASVYESFADKPYGQDKWVELAIKMAATKLASMGGGTLSFGDSSIPFNLWRRSGLNAAGSDLTYSIEVTPGGNVTRTLKRKDGGVINDGLDAMKAIPVPRAVEAMRGLVLDSNSTPVPVSIWKGKYSEVFQHGEVTTVRTIIPEGVSVSPRWGTKDKDGSNGASVTLHSTAGIAPGLSYFDNLVALGSDWPVDSNSSYRLDAGGEPTGAVGRIMLQWGFSDTVGAPTPALALRHAEQIDAVISMVSTGEIPRLDGPVPPSNYTSYPAGLHVKVGDDRRLFVVRQASGGGAKVEFRIPTNDSPADSRMDDLLIDYQTAKAPVGSSSVTFDGRELIQADHYGVLYDSLIPRMVSKLAKSAGLGEPVVVPDGDRKWTRITITPEDAKRIIDDAPLPLFQPLVGFDPEYKSDTPTPDAIYRQDSASIVHAMTVSGELSPELSVLADRILPDRQALWPTASTAAKETARGDIIERLKAYRLTLPGDQEGGLITWRGPNYYDVARPTTEGAVRIIPVPAARMQENEGDPFGSFLPSDEDMNDLTESTQQAQAAASATPAGPVTATAGAPKNPKAAARLAAMTVRAGSRSKFTTWENVRAGWSAIFGNIESQLITSTLPGSEARKAAEMLAGDIERIQNIAEGSSMKMLWSMNEVIKKAYKGVPKKQVNAELELLAKYIHRMSQGDRQWVGKMTPGQKAVWQHWAITNGAIIGKAKQLTQLVDTVLMPWDDPEAMDGMLLHFRTRNINGILVDTFGTVVGGVKGDHLLVQQDHGGLAEIRVYQRFSRIQMVDPDVFFPRWLSEDAQAAINAKQGPLWDALVAEYAVALDFGGKIPDALLRNLEALDRLIAKKKGADIATAERLARKMLEPDISLSGVTGGASRTERARAPFVLSERWYDFDFKKVTANHITKSALRQAAGRIWEHDYSTLGYYLSQITDGRASFQDMIISTLGLQGGDTVGMRNVSRFIAWEGAWQMTSKLSGLTTTALQLNQTAMAFARYGTKAYFEGWKDMAAAIPSWKEHGNAIHDVIMSGAIESAYMEQIELGEEELARKVSNFVATVTGIKPVDSFLRVQAALVSEAALRGTAERLQKFSAGGRLSWAAQRRMEADEDLLRSWMKLTENQIKALKKKGKAGITDSMRLLAHHAGSRTQIRVRKSDLPAVTRNHPVWRLIFRFQQFNIGQARLLWLASEELAAGRPGMMLRMILGYLAVGWLTLEMRNRIVELMVGERDPRTKRPKAVPAELFEILVKAGMFGFWSRATERVWEEFAKADSVDDATRITKTVIDSLSPQVPVVSDVTAVVKGVVRGAETRSVVAGLDETVKESVVLWRRLRNRVHPSEAIAKARVDEAVKVWKSQGLNSADISDMKSLLPITPDRYATPAFQAWATARNARAAEEMGMVKTGLRSPKKAAANLDTWLRKQKDSPSGIGEKPAELAGQQTKAEKAGKLKPRGSAGRVELSQGLKEAGLESK